ncbi:flavin reductase [Thermoclostridium stercorarium subsp. thermolacticum DSM 2910]|uniref:Flavin reductase n=1 Tax=Thermoclostridium stercorarium subsp. thermolacticum DSM 2910 TaxID=1121336 RepID=A0A1B1YAG9_THEST|nr:flavin reductase [Thermoclostridium stercorarium]ANW97767.1 flavin reductase [Thermoclostridium stercorarium subsp. thermolacticum DSM 2910]
MAAKFVKISPQDIKDNPFKAIGDEWMLVTAGSLGSYNTMTASWGGLGVLWGKNIAFCVIRPTRYTYEFMEKADTFTLCFFDGKYKKALSFCGTHSGRDYDKARETGLTAAETENGSVYFNEARLVLECKKLYYDDINPRNFVDPEIDSHYPDKDYHRMYVGEIINVLKKADDTE